MYAIFNYFITKKYCSYKIPSATNQNCRQQVSYLGARCSSVVERPLMVQWVIGSIPHGGLIELFLVPVSAQRLV